MGDPFFNAKSQDHFDDLARRVAKGSAIVVIGAGLSVEAGFPTWGGLHTNFVEHFQRLGVDAPKHFNPEFAPRMFAEFRERFASDADYLSFMKDQFATPKPVPESYRVLPDTFAILATTNYDLSLQRAAELHEDNPAIYHYPRTYLHERYAYLHGHIQHACGRNDLVLCEDDYEQAYEDSGNAYMAFRSLLQEAQEKDGACVIIGSSLSDYDLNRLLRKLSKIRVRAAASGGERAALYSNAPPWFAFLAARLDPNPFENWEGVPDDVIAAQEQKHLDNYVLRQSEFLEYQGIKPIWYAYNKEIRHSRLLALLRMLRDVRVPGVRKAEVPVFLTDLAELRRLGAVDQPGEDERIWVANSIRTDPTYRRHFYLDATSPAWLGILDERGLITAIDPPQPLSDGNVQASYWEAGAYVKKMADRAPDSVVAILKKIETENWGALSDCAETVLSLPVIQAVEVIPQLIKWIHSQYADVGLVKHFALEFLKKLVDAEHTDAAIMLLTEMIQPTRGQSGALIAGYPKYQDGDLIRIAARLVPRQPSRVIDLLRKTLLAGLALEYKSELANWSGWRGTIEDSSQNMPLGSVLDLLVDMLRDCLMAVAEQDKDRAKSFLDSFLRSDISILQRIATYVAGRDVGLAKASESVLFPDETMFEANAFHEHATFLKQRFGDMSPSFRSRIEGQLRKGPAPHDEEPISKYEARRDYWRWRMLYVIPQGLLDQDDQAWMTEQRKKRPAPEMDTYTSYAQVFMPSSPASPDDLSEWWRHGIDQFMNVMREPEKYFDMDVMRESGLIWETLAQLIVETPSEFLAIADRLTLTDLQVQEAWRFTYAYTKLARDGVAFDWVPLIRMAERILDEGAVIKLNDDDRWAWAIAGLIRDALDASSPIPNILLPRAFSILEAVLDMYGTQVEADLAPMQLRDFSMRQLNSPGGKAADGILVIAARCLRTMSDEEADEGKEIASALASQIMDRIEASLADGTASIEIRYAVGHFLLVPERLRRNWVHSHLRQLFPENSDVSSRSAALAFVTGYIWVPNVYNDLLVALNPCYKRLIEDVIQPEPTYLVDQSRREFLSNHVVIGWLRGIEGFGLDGYLGLLLSESSDSLRGHIARFIGRAYADAVKSNDDEWMKRLWPLMDAYWQARADLLGTTLPSAAPSEESSAFAGWLADLPVAIWEIEDRLMLIIEHADKGFVLESVSEAVAPVASDQPAFVARITRALVTKFVHTSSIGWWSLSLESLLQGIWRSGDRNLQRDVMQMISDLLQFRGMDFRGIMEG